MSLPPAQLYLALYLRLIPLPAVVQDEIIPVVRSFSFLAPLLAFFPHPPFFEGGITQKWLAGWLTGARPEQLPLWALVSFGAYLLASLGWGVLTFNDVPAAHAEIMGEIETAKVELRKLGVTVD